ncbi:MAG: hypothetical protein RL298_1968, partial [Pseudomonadota bacterium]
MCRWVAYAGPEIYLEDLMRLNLRGSPMVMGSAWLGTTIAPHQACSKTSCQPGMTVTCAPLQLIYKPDYFLPMFVLPLAQRSTEATAIHLRGKTGPSCTTAKLATGMT